MHVGQLMTLDDQNTTELECLECSEASMQEHLPGDVYGQKHIWYLQAVW